MLNTEVLSLIECHHLSGILLSCGPAQIVLNFERKVIKIGELVVILPQAVISFKQSEDFNLIYNLKGKLIVNYGFFRFNF